MEVILLPVPEPLIKSARGTRMLRCSLILRWEFTRGDRTYDCAVRVPSLMFARGENNRILTLPPRHCSRVTTTFLTPDLCAILEEEIAKSPWEPYIGEDNNINITMQGYCPKHLLPKRLNKKKNTYEQDPIEVKFESLFLSEELPADTEEGA